MAAVLMPSRGLMPRVVSSGSMEKYFGVSTDPTPPASVAASPRLKSMAPPRVVSSGSLERYVECAADAAVFMLPRVISSGAIEQFVEPDEPLSPAASGFSVSRASFCSLADLPAGSGYSFSIGELHRLLGEPAVAPPPTSEYRPTLGTTWEYIRNPRRPDSATSNSLASSSERDEQEEEALLEEAEGAAAGAKLSEDERMSDDDDDDDDRPLRPAAALPPLITSVSQAMMLEEEAAEEEAAPHEEESQWVAPPPFVVYDGGSEVMFSPEVRSPMSVFEAGRWY